jgi:hypothetical protein
MIHPPEIVEGTLYKRGCPTPLSHVLCQLHEDQGKDHDYRCWQGTLEAIWKPWDLWHLTLKFGAYILELSDGRRGLIFTGKWRGGYASPRTAQFVGPGPTAFEREWLYGPMA